MNINKKIILSLFAGVLLSITSLGLAYQTTFAAECNDGTPIPTSELRDDRQFNFCTSHGGIRPADTDQPNIDRVEPEAIEEADAQKIYNQLAIAINILSGLVGIIIVISIVFAGIQYTISSGDPQKVAAAKSRIFTSIFAFLAFIFLYAFLQYLVPGGVF